MWGTDIRYLNDHTELKHGIELIEGQLDEAIKQQSQMEVVELLTSLRNSFHLYGWKTPQGDVDFHSCFVSCFCKEGDLLSQWRGYGSSGGGYAVGIRPCQHINVMDTSPTIKLKKVIYAESEQLQLVRDSINCVVECANFALPNISNWKGACEKISTLFRDEISDYLWCFKNPAFSEEQEWRFMYLTNPFDPNSLKTLFRPNLSGIIPYVELDIFKQQKNEPYFDICEIICGPRLDPEGSVKAVKQLLNSSKYAGIAVNKSGVPLRW
jgi:hypothetical protein